MKQTADGSDTKAYEWRPSFYGSQQIARNEKSSEKIYFENLERFHLDRLIGRTQMLHYQHQDFGLL